MARKGASRNAITGQMEAEPGARNIFYDAFHQTGSFDPRMSDPDFLAGKQSTPAPRGVVQLMLAANTISDLKRLTEAMGRNRGRVVDKLVSLAIEQLDEVERRGGRKTGKGGKDEKAFDPFNFIKKDPSFSVKGVLEGKEKEEDNAG